MVIHHMHIMYHSPVHIEQDMGQEIYLIGHSKGA